MIRLGIFGGTFAPFHTGHLTALKSFLRDAELDHCLVLPSGIPPHKEKPLDFTDQQRVHMCRIACATLPNTELCHWEIDQRKKSYTVETLRRINQNYPNALPVLYVGSDMFLSLQNWYCPQEIFQRAEIAAFSRTGEDLEELNRHRIALQQRFNEVRCTVYSAPPVSVSSTEIREKWKRGESVSSLVPVRVAEYLSLLRLERFRHHLQQRLTPKRLCHSEGVMEEAVCLAKIFGIDEEKAKIAGLLHDMTKELPKEEHFRIFEAHNANPDENLRNNPNLWHALSASYDISDTFGISDPEICSAIRYHTTGKANMTPLETLLFLADAIEPNRTYEDLAFYRTLARENLEKAAYLVMVWTISDLKRRGLKIHPDTLDGCAFLAKKFPNVTIETEKQRMYSTKGS